MAEDSGIFLKRALWCLGMRCSLSTVLHGSGGWMELEPLLPAGGGEMQV